MLHKCIIFYATFYGCCEFFNSHCCQEYLEIAQLCCLHKKRMVRNLYFPLVLILTTPPTCPALGVFAQAVSSAPSTCLLKPRPSASLKHHILWQVFSDFLYLQQFASHPHAPQIPLLLHFCSLFLFKVIHLGVLPLWASKEAHTKAVKATALHSDSPDFTRDELVLP